MAHVLLIEDDASIRTGLVTALQHEGHEVADREHGDGLEADEAVDLTSVDVAILDVGLPRGPDGIELARMLTASHGIPVIVLTAQDDFEFKAAGYRAGADLYVTKPFSVTELLWQLTALLRRTKRDDGQLVAGQVRVDLVQRMAWSDGTELSLTPTEINLLAVLVRHSGQVLSKARLLQLVWGEGYFDDNLVEAAIRRLRAKIGDHGHDIIRTVRGAGYRLSA